MGGAELELVAANSSEDKGSGSSGEARVADVGAGDQLAKGRCRRLTTSLVK